MLRLSDSLCLGNSNTTNNNSLNQPILSDKLNKIIIAKGDSAATAHYWREQDIPCLNDIIFHLGSSLTLPNNEIITSNMQGQLSLLPSLSHQATTANILPSLQSFSLISLRQLCDDDCDFLLNNKQLFVVKENSVVM